MFLQFIGWLSIVLFLVVITLNWVIFAFNYLGKWTIGGAENSVITRLTVLFFGAIITYGWYVTGTMAPFTISFGVN